MMRFRYFVLLLLSLPCSRLHGQHSAGSSPATASERHEVTARREITARKEAEDLIRQSQAAMGGEAWDTVRSLQLEAYTNVQDIDQSERPEGPYIPSQEKSIFKEDRIRKKAFLTTTTLDYTFENTASYILDGAYIAAQYNGQLMPVEQDQSIQDNLFLAPENILSTASQAEDLRFVKDTIFQQAEHAMISFHWGMYPVRIFLNKETSLLTAVIVTKPYTSGYATIWGDSQKTTLYSFWNFIGKGLHYPLQRDTYLNGWYQQSYLVTKWQVNPTVDAVAWTIPDTIRTQCDRMAKGMIGALKQNLDQNKKEIAPGIWLLPGPCNSTVIEQPDGLVAIEASVSSAYGGLLLEKIRSMFPGKKIKALISTSDAWYHIGGIRPFAALPGITIYHPYRNKFILQKLLQADYHTHPDSFALETKHTYQLVGIRDSMVIGTGDNQLILYPYCTETGDRQMMVCFPQRQLVYTSDLYQPKSGDGTYWNPHIAWEVYHSILTRGLSVKQFYGMHTRSVLPFSTLENDFK
jgi:hypothetical protein